MQANRERTATAEGWQVEESAAEAYERYLVPAIAAAWARELVDLAAPRPGERALDVACGTGIVARTLAGRPGAGPVTGLDVNPAMLAVAREAGRGLGIEWVEGSAEALPFAERSFDLVLCQAALMFFPDPAAALGEMHRVLGRGGRVALGVPRALEHQPAYACLAAALGEHASPAAAEMTRSIFSLGAADELRSLLAAAGFREIRARISVGAIRYPSFRELVRREAAISPLADGLLRLPAARLEAVASRVAEAMAGYEDDFGVALPIEAHVLTAAA
jgi:ubiquinone/menaquinone biosynthesis C-methylase UbiE